MLKEVSSNVMWSIKVIRTLIQQDRRGKKYIHVHTLRQ